MFRSVLSQFPGTCATIVTAAAATLAIPSVGSAQSWMADVEDVIAVEVIPGWRRADGSHVAGLRFALAPGWKTYWRSAGAAGIPPHFDWSAAENVSEVAIAWPTPKVFLQGDYQSIGYEDDFILPVIFEATDPSAPVEMRAVLDLGVCADICLPAQLDVAATLPVEDAVVPDLAAALADQPEQRDVAVACELAPSNNGAILTGEMQLPVLSGREAVVFELPDPTLWITDAEVDRDGTRLYAMSEVMMAGDTPVHVDFSDVRITVIGDDGAVEIRGCQG